MATVQVVVFIVYVLAVRTAWLVSLIFAHPFSVWIVATILDWFDARLFEQTAWISNPDIYNTYDKIADAIQYVAFFTYYAVFYFHCCGIRYSRRRIWIWYAPILLGFYAFRTIFVNLLYLLTFNRTILVYAPNGSEPLQLLYGVLDFYGGIEWLRKHRAMHAIIAIVLVGIKWGIDIQLWTVHNEQADLFTDPACSNLTSCLYMMAYPVPACMIFAIMATYRRRWPYYTRVFVSK